MSVRLSPQLAAWRYVLERPLGDGASSQVWLARNAQGEPVALKIARSPAHTSRLADEGERLLFARSRGLANLIDAGFVPRSAARDEPRLAPLVGRAYLALEHVEGEALAPERIAAEERERIALAVARDVGEALADLHALGTAHGDVKPGNVVVARSKRRAPRARLIDLGLGTDADAPSARGGTPRYLAPEVFQSASGDARSRDAFALGLTLAEIASDPVARASEPLGAASSASLPGELAPIVRALLSGAPGARPSAAWVHRRALDALGEHEVDDAERARASVQRAYLAVRRAEILRAATHAETVVEVGGLPGRWLASALELAGKIARLRADSPRAESAEIADLDGLGRASWLVALAGPAASRWPRSRFDDDAALAERLWALAAEQAPASLTFAALGAGVAAREALPDDPVALALRLGAGDTSEPVLVAAERSVVRGAAPAALVLALGRALRLKGELGRSLSVLATLDDPRAVLEAADALRRAGDRAGAEAKLEGLRDESPAIASRHASIAARMALDSGDSERAAQLLAGVEASAPVEETRALVALAKGERKVARDALARGLDLASNDEERARLAAVAGSIAHAAGEAELAEQEFRRAVEHAVRAGAVLEEATYLTGLAAAAANVGALDEALASARRASLLFEHLGRPRDAARALLTRTAVYAQAGAVAETRDAAREAMRRARSADDKRCRAYVHLALADVLQDSDPEAVEHAERAAALLADAEPDERLFAAARLLRRGRVGDVATFDARARSPEAAVDARLDWWGARALAEATSERPTRPELVLTELSALASVRAPASSRGPALAAGARLAARVGDGDAARRFALGAREAARELMRRAPPELATAISTLPWILAGQAPREAEVSSEQVADVETLVRALGRRDRLRPLLDQVLDALILWTGVERGLLLLSAPGGRFVPRAARNIARADLHGEQLALSTSLAERAAREREPVVAVDAAGEISDVYSSVHALNLRSVLAVPLLARGEVLGIAYLDDRVRRGAFGPAELAWVRLVAALASLAIADARDQLLLRRAARRAERAEARLADELAKREAALDVAERELARTRPTRFEYEQIVGQSEQIGALLRTVDRVAVSEVPVLIVGESGSGKELVARAIHRHGARSKRAFVSENCGAIPESLLESTLFGHVRGAFTGADRPRAGLFEVANGGTLFLDEIGEMSLGMQTKLLRALEAGEINPVGAERPRKVNVRVIGATNRDLTALVAAGSFREDLLYRLDVITLRVPALRERRGDIPLLVRHFLEKHAKGRPIRLTREALERLGAYAWPGNIRQLENEIRRALVLADDCIDVEHLSPEVRDAGAATAAVDELDLRGRVDALESELVAKALAETGGNQTRAAELLGLSRFGLQKMMKRLGVGSAAKPGRRAPGAVVRGR